MQANCDIDETTKTAELRLQGSLTIQHAAELKKILTGTLEQAETTLLNLADVDGYDLSAIQLLYAYHLACSNESKVFQLQGDCPELFREAVENAGFSWADWLCFGEKQ